MESDPLAKQIRIDHSSSDVRSSYLETCYRNQHSHLTMTQHQIQQDDVFPHSDLYILYRQKQVYGERESSMLRDIVNPFSEFDQYQVFANRAAVKLANIDYVFSLFDNKTKDITFCDICAGPGAFTEYVQYMYPTSRGYGMTLKHKTLDWDFSVLQRDRFEAFYGPDQTGDIFTNWEHFATYVKSTCKNGVDVVTADGGIDIDTNGNHDTFESQERINTKLFLGQCVTSLHCLREGGHCAIKLFDTFLPITHQLIYAMSACFSYIDLFKPCTSRPGNCEKYLVCHTFMKNDKSMEAMKRLTDLYRHMVSSSETNDVWNLEVPSDFLEWMKRKNKESYDRQYAIAVDTKSCLENKIHMNPKRFRVCQYDTFKAFTLMRLSMARISFDPKRVLSRVTSKTQTHKSSSFPKKVIEKSREYGLPFDYESFTTVESSEYSCLMPYHVKPVNDFLKELYDMSTVSLVVDATSNVGVDTVNFFYQFPHARILSYEIDSDTFEALSRNVKGLNVSKRVEPVYGDFLLHLDSCKRADVVFIDCPWGGRSYKDKQQLDLFLQPEGEKEDASKNVIHITHELLHRFHVKSVVLKVPFNYNFSAFKGVFSPDQYTTKQRTIYTENNKHVSYVLLYVERLDEEKRIAKMTMKWNKWTENHHLKERKEKEFIVSNGFTRVLREDAPRKPYKESDKHERKTTLHWGQRKLLMSEIELLTTYSQPGDIFVYAGAAPGKHLQILADMFPEVIFHLYDPGTFYEFDMKYSHQIIVYTGKSGFFDDNTALSYKGKNALFASDIRLFSPGKKLSLAEQNEAVQRDMEDQMRWCKVMECKKAILKFRLPWSSDESKTTTYLGGDIYLPVWGRQHTPECRLICDWNKEKEYHDRKYEDQMYFFNMETRVQCYKHACGSNASNDHIVASGLDHCYDCTAETYILKEYYERIISTNQQNENTHRQLVQRIGEHNMGSMDRFISSMVTYISSFLSDDKCTLMDSARPWDDDIFDT